MTDTSNIIDSATASTILKWAITILVAGFIAQFGKKFATYLIEKTKAMRKGKKEADDGPKEASITSAHTVIHEKDYYSAASAAAAEKARLKLEKKKLKYSMKEKKK